MTKKQIATARVQFLTLCWGIGLVGWNDGSTGPLLLRIQNYYHVSYIVVSLLFVFACIGFIIGALLIVPLTNRLGLGKSKNDCVAGSICPIVAYSLQAATLPFPVYVMSFTLNGIGMALLDALSNGFVAALKHNANTKMGILHAAYGLGAFCSPLVATQFAQLPHWSYHYLVSLGIAFVNLIIMISVFRFRTQDELLAQIGQASTLQSTSDDSTFSQIIHSKTVHFLALFLLVYVGVEVTIGGWIVAFIVTVRDGGPSAGYISAGFFGGLTLGRVVLLWVNKKVGERRVIFIYAAIAIGFELLVWFVPSLIGDAVAISIIGLLLGPMYPITMNHSGRVLPPWILTGAIGWLAGVGQAGSAMLPFITGAVAQKWGIRSLQPLLVVMMTIMVILWALVPSQAVRRSD
ncbi:MFS general substrate transporter [Amanita muscaria]